LLLPSVKRHTLRHKALTLSWPEMFRRSAGWGIWAGPVPAVRRPGDSNRVLRVLSAPNAADLTV
jgi:hypothetical protein